MPSLFPIKEGLFLNNKNQKEYNNQFSIIMLHSIYTQFLGFIQNQTFLDFYPKLYRVGHNWVIELNLDILNIFSNCTC